MSVPQNILDDLTALQAQLAAAEQLETDTTLALLNAAGGLDTWVAPSNQIGIINGVQAAVMSASDQWYLMDMLEVISRAVLNLDLMTGDIGIQPTRKVLIPVS